MSFIPGTMTLKDGAQLDAFGGLIVSAQNTLFDAQQEYGLDTRRIWSAAANGTLASASSDGSATDGGGNSVGPRDVNSRLTPITVTATNGHYAILQSQQYVRYIPGHGQRSYITGVFAAGSGYTAKLVLRTSTSGSASDAQFAPQSGWSEDHFDGTGPSGITLDFTKIQILVIDAQMLYAGRVRVGFDVDGVLYWAHYFKIANNQALPTLQTYNLPIRIEGRTDADSTDFRFGSFDLANGVFLETSRLVKGGTVQFECSSVQSSGGLEGRGFPRSTNNGITSINCNTTGRPVLSIRPAATFNGLVNRSHIEDVVSTVLIGSGSALWEARLGCTLTGAAFASVGTDSVAEVDVAATAATGGVVIGSGYVSGGAIAARGSSTKETDPRNPLVLNQIDALASTQTPITIFVRALTGTVDASAAMDWYEQTL